MDTIKLNIGTSRTLRSGQPDDNLRPVEFEAEELANATRYGENDTRGVTETLYKTADASGGQRALCCPGPQGRPGPAADAGRSTGRVRSTRPPWGSLGRAIA